MFADLLAEDIQPKRFDVQHFPEIVLPEVLRVKLEEMFKTEEKGFVKVNANTTTVQTASNYVFFSNQWFCLAILCKKFAEALKPYCDFFDNEIRNNADIWNIFKANESVSDIKTILDTNKLKDILPNDDDRERIVKFVRSDKKFRPGKSFVNKENKNPRTTEDVFGSCVLKKIPVPDASSSYLGDIIYYLTMRPDLYNNLASEILRQMENAGLVTKLPQKAKYRAEKIINHIYSIDRLKAISSLLYLNKDNNKDTIKIKVNNNAIQFVYWPRHLFVLPNLNDSRSDEEKDKLDRVFSTEYDVEIGDVLYKCKLTDQWDNVNDPAKKTDHNNVPALIELVNKYYADYLEISEEAGGYYLYKYKKEQSFRPSVLSYFDFSELPKVFTDNDFARRYITSLLAKPFVILTGGSGTGKTRICKQLAEYLEVVKDGEKNWLIVPVGADWTDNTKIMGFYNPLADGGNGKYEETNILKLIERANSNQDVPYFIILDEMNLSHVERYFSDFLSHMETREPFVLDGYKKNEVTNEVTYPDNLFVVGTVNIDETTYMFSPKVLDRANVVEFKPDKNMVLDIFDSDLDDLGIVETAKQGTAEAFLELAKEIRNGKHKIDTGIMTELKTVFAEIYEYTKKCDYEFAYRTVREIRQYIFASSVLCRQEFVIWQAIDEQLLQKILPKVHGNKKEIAKLLDELEVFCGLEELEKFCNTNNLSELGKLCKKKKDEYKAEEKVNMLELSAEKIRQMKGKLAKVQYASFI